MNTKFKWAAFALLGVFWLFSYAGYGLAAEEEMAMGESCPLDSSITGPSEFSGYIGTLALDRENRELGRVVHVTYGTGASYGSPNNVVKFLIISSCLGDMRDKLVAFPVKLADVPPGSRTTLVLDTTQEEFRGAPTIATKAYQSKTGWQGQSYHYFLK